VILVRRRIRTICRIPRAAAVLTSRGGITSHAAVVTRGLGKPAVVGCTDVLVEPERHRLSANGSAAEGDEISVDGFTGEVFEDTSIR
jgi:pyruvate,orthophosphate dikinase